MTPPLLARQIVESLDLDGVHRILEPSCGEGAFLAALGEQLGQAPASSKRGVEVVGVEIDRTLARSAARIARQYRELPGSRCEVIQGDFFRQFQRRGAASQPRLLAEPFDLIVGNPPFGGSIAPDIEDRLDALLGQRLGRKIKKETYAFFIVACMELLRPGGRLVFICSDTLLTIPTMTGLRHWLMHNGRVVLHRLDEFSDETNYPMLVLEYVHGEGQGSVCRFGEPLRGEDIAATANLSWGVSSKVAALFRGPKLGDVMVATSGMTTGKNEYFVREMSPEGTIWETCDFRFYDAPLSLEYELQRARLNKLPPKRRRQLREAEARGDTERRVEIAAREQPSCIALPHDDYRPYNKANGRIVYSPPTHVIYWKDDGDAVLTYKRTGNWYLRGVGGMPYFGREGLTWQLIASRFVPRYLPAGYILDSGAPCAFPRPGVDEEEIYFVLGWLLSPLASEILKTVINHTMNIQSKDFERMPYPWWVGHSDKRRAIAQVREMIEAAKAGRAWRHDDDELRRLAAMYSFDEHDPPLANDAERTSAQVQSTMF